MLRCKASRTEGNQQIISLWYFDIDLNILLDISDCGESVSSTFKYEAGCEQQFAEDEQVFEPGSLLGDGYDPSNGQNTIPLAILMETDTQEGQLARADHNIIGCLTPSSFSPL